MLKTAIQCNAMPLKQKCILCSTNDATYRCLKCAPSACYCPQCEEHNILFVWCACEPMVLTIVRARIWPSIPQRPNLAFTFYLLDWAESLLLEC